MMRKILSLGVLQSLVLAVNVARSKVLALLLGPAGYGVVSTIDQLVQLVVQVTNFSLPFTAMKFLSRSHSISESQFQRTYAAFFKILMVMALISTVLAISIVPSNLDRLDPLLASYRTPVFVALLGIPATMMLMFLANVLAARQASSLSVLLPAASGAVMLIGGATGYILGGITGLYVGIVPAVTALAVLAAIIMRRRWGLRGSTENATVWRELRGSSEVFETAFYGYVAVSSGAAQLFMARYAAISTISEEAAGWVQAGLAVSLTVGAVVVPANTLYLSPYVNRAVPAADKVDAAHRFLPLMVLLFCLVALPTLLFPNLFITLLFSAAFKPAVAILPLFLAWQFLFHVSNIYQQLLIGLDDVRAYGLITTAGNTAAAVLCFSLTTQLGIPGIAISFIIGAILTFALTVRRLRKRHGYGIPRSSVGRIVLAALLLSIVIIAGSLTAEASLTGLLARSATALVALGAIWYVCPRSVRTEVSSALARKLRGKGTAS